jgi:hypothetical protein
MACKCGAVECVNKDCDRKITPAQIGPVDLLQGVAGDRNCIRFEDPRDMLCRLLNALEQGDNLAVGDTVVGPDCRTHAITPELVRALISVADTASVDMQYDPATGVISATINDPYVRGLLGAQGSPCVAFTYDANTGIFSVDVDSNCIATEGICAALASLTTVGTATYNPGGTLLVGKDCATYTIPAQRLTFVPATRELTISDGNTIVIPDTFVTSFTISGNTATIVLNNGQVFQQTIPTQFDINVQSFTINGSTLTITETDGSVHTLNLPTDTRVIGFQSAGPNLVLTQNDGSVFNVPIPDTFECARAIACLTSGQNVDIQPGGLVSAGYLRDNGDNTYTWVDPNSNELYTLDLAPILCPQVLALPRVTGPAAGFWAFDAVQQPGTPGIQCVLRYVPASSNVVVTSTNNTVQTTLQTVTDAQGIVTNTYDLSVDICALVGARPQAAAITQGELYNVFDPVLCVRREVRHPLDVIVRSPDGSVAVTPSTLGTALIYDLTVPPANASPPLNVTIAGAGAVALTETQSGVLNHDVVFDLNLDRLPNAGTCAEPVLVVGDNNQRYQWSAMRSTAAVAYGEASFAQAIPTGPSTGGPADSGPVIQTVNAGIVNTHPCRPMAYTANLRSGRTAFNFIGGQAAGLQLGKQITLTGPNTANGNSYYTLMNAMPAGLAATGIAHYPSDVWTVSGTLAVGATAAFSISTFGFWLSIVTGVTPLAGTSMSFGRAHITILGATV